MHMMLDAVRQPAFAPWRRVRRALRAARAWLRRHARLAAPVAALTVALAEPLLCIGHCQLWLPMMLAASSPGAHAAHNAGHSGHHAHSEAAPVETLPAVGDGAQHIGEHGPACALGPANEAGGMPYHLPPSPVREAVLAAVPALAVALLVAVLSSVRSLSPPSIALAPPFRPPAHTRSL
jgi:hypothetical protein